MGLHAEKILGINITSDSKKTILEELEKRLTHQGKNGVGCVTVVTPNPEQIVYAKRDRRFADILNRADVAIPDGGGIVWAYRTLGGKEHLRRIPGVEFMEDLVAIAAKRGVTIGLIGGRGDLAVRTLECLLAKYPGLRGWAVDPDSVSLTFLAEKIRKTNARIVFVALGAPKQEYFIARLRRECQMPNAKCQIFMSVGGSFDIIAGRIPRAPAWMRGLGLEFLWRLFREPRRFGRQLALVKFVWLVLRERYF